MRNFISYDESINILNNINTSKITTEKLFITNALQRVIAKDVIADHNSPEFPTSAMDGYAIKFEDIKNENIKIIAKNPAGSVVKEEVITNTCIKTFTGSLMPKGSDTLIPIENVEIIDDKIKIIKKKILFNRCVDKRYREKKTRNKRKCKKV